MDIATTYAATQSAMLQDTMALLMVKQQASAGQAVASMLEQALQVTNAILGDPGAGIGEVVDIQA